MKYKIVLTFLVISTILMPGMAQDRGLVVELDKALKYGSLIFENPAGNIRVTGYEGDLILVNGRHRLAGNSKKAPEGLKRLEQTRFSLEADVNNNNVFLSCESGGNIVDFDIQVPKYLKLKLSTRGSGSIEVFGLDAEIEANNNDGPVSCYNISRSVILNSIYGNISVRFRKLDTTTPMMITTYEGNIELYLPEKANADLTMRSRQGDLFSDFDLDYEKSRARVSGNEEGMKYELDNWTKGRLNRGGVEFIMSSYYGDIAVKKK